MIIQFIMYLQLQIKTWYIFTMLLLNMANQYIWLLCQAVSIPKHEACGDVDETVRRVTECSITMLQNEHVVCDLMMSFILFFPQGFCNRSVMKKGFYLVSVVGWGRV